MQSSRRLHPLERSAQSAVAVLLFDCLRFVFVMPLGKAIKGHHLRQLLLLVATTTTKIILDVNQLQQVTLHFDVVIRSSGQQTAASEGGRLQCIIVASVVQCYLEEQEECLWNIEEGSSSSKSVLSGNSP